jgi:hypothetical protein
VGQRCGAGDRIYRDVVGSMKFPYVYGWKNNSKRLTLYGRRFRVIVRMKMNSALVEFEDGQVEVISRNAIRKAA